MRLALCVLTFSIAIQAGPREDTIKNMAMNLAALKDLVPEPDGVLLMDPRDMQEPGLSSFRKGWDGKHPAEAVIMGRLMRNIRGAYNGLTFGAAYTLITGLAGHEVNPAGLDKLGSALIDVLDSAYEVKKHSSLSTRLWQDDDFQRSIARYYQPIKARGVSEENARIIGGNLAAAAENIVSTGSIVRPIPPVEHPPFELHKN